MKAGHKILYHCRENSSHRLLLVRAGNYSDSWKWYVYSEATGEIIDRSIRETGIEQAERAETYPGIARAMAAQWGKV